MGSFPGKNSRSMFHCPNGANATAAEQSDPTDQQKKINRKWMIGLWLV